MNLFVDQHYSAITLNLPLSVTREQNLLPPDGLMFPNNHPFFMVKLTPCIFVSHPPGLCVARRLAYTLSPALKYMIPCILLLSGIR